MKTLYIDCGMGAAGDMLTAALYELLDEKERIEFLNQMNGIGIPEVEFKAETSTKCGILGTHMKVSVHGEEEESHDEHEHGTESHHHEHKHHAHQHDYIHDDEKEHNHEHHHSHHHASMGEIESIITNLQVSDKVKNQVIGIYKLIAEAESSVHGVPVTEIHFHEVGSKDAIADVTAVCVLLEKLNVQKIIASPVHVGSGQVHCAHGILPVPAPATALLLKDIPIYGGKIKGELCTPTGAAILKYFVSDFGDMPVMKIGKIGYGMGKKDFDVANCVRVIFGDDGNKSEQILEFTCNLDDLSAEKIGFAMEQLFNAGALEVYTISVGMKKNRPGHLLCVMCRESKKEEMLHLIFKHTTTLGIRENISKRYSLERRIENISSEFGDVRVKISEGYGITRQKLEYEDLARIAREQNLSIMEVEKRINK